MNTRIFPNAALPAPRATLRRRDAMAGAVRQATSLWRSVRGFFEPAPSRTSGFAELADLDARLLRDVGAPEHLLACALARAEARRDAHDALRAGQNSGGWRGW